MYKVALNVCFHLLFEGLKKVADMPLEKLENNIIQVYIAVF
jgi:hypothetical protein